MFDEIILELQLGGHEEGRSKATTKKARHHCKIPIVDKRGLDGMIQAISNGRNVVQR